MAGSDGARDFVERLRTELPRLLRDDVEVRGHIIALLSDYLTTRQETAAILAELRQMHEDFERRMDEFARRMDEQGRRIDETGRRIDETGQRIDEMGRRLEEHSHRLEEHSHRLEELTHRIEEQNKTLTEHTRVLSEHTRTLSEQTHTLSEHTRTLSEQTQTLSEHTRTLSEQTQTLTEHTRVLSEHGRALGQLERTVSGVGARWGILNEEAFRRSVAALFADQPEVRVEHWRHHDAAGTVLGYPADVDMDVVLRDGTLTLIEIKSSISVADVTLFLRRTELYRNVTGRKPDRLLMIGPFIEERAYEAGKRFGIELVSGVTPPSV
jgi:hypothetical protein